MVMLRRDLTELFLEVPGARGEFTEFAAPSRVGETSHHGVTWSGRFRQPTLTQIMHAVRVNYSIKPDDSIEAVIVSMLLEAGGLGRVEYAQSVVPDIYADLPNDLLCMNYRPHALIVSENWPKRRDAVNWPDRRYEDSWLAFVERCGLDRVFLTPRLDAKTLIAVATPEELGMIVTGPSGRGIVIPDARAVAVRTLPPLTVWDKLMSEVV